MGDYGIKILSQNAPPGVDITSNNPKHYTFWSKLESKTIYQRTTISLYLGTSGSYTTTSTLYHNLGYKPQVWAFFNDCSNRYQKLPLFGGSGVDLSDCTYCVKGDGHYLDLYFKVYDNRIEFILTAYCYIHQYGDYNILYPISLTIDVYIFREKIY